MKPREIEQPPHRLPRWVTASAFWPALAGSLMLWAAFPPIGWTVLAWVAPVFWLVLARRDTLPGRHPYLAIWAAGLVHWLLMLQGIRLAHWLNHFGWFALSAYLAAYLPLFVGLTRVAVHRWRVSIVIAAPMVWTGLELARAHLLTGFSLGSLGHTQVEWTTLIQIADLGGAYAVGFVMMLYAACLARIVPMESRRWTWWPLAPLVATVGLTLVYGEFRMREYRTLVRERALNEDQQPLRVALLQEVVDTRFEFNPERNLDTFELYWEAALRAREQNPELDVILWPEGVFTENQPELRREESFRVPEDVSLSRTEFTKRVDERADAFQQKVQKAAEGVNRLWRDGRFEQLDVHLLVGTETIDFGPDKMAQYNSALLIDPQGEITDRYFKMHPVMFGEYLPFGETFPWIYRLAPLARGLSRGSGGVSFEVAGWRLAPSICFESSVPHLIRRQVVELDRAGERPDALVNLTHDGWFFGSSILDLQFAGAVFRAVELRCPMLVAANAGISCLVAGDGTVTARGPRRDPAILVVDVMRDGRVSLYERIGDVPAGACLSFCIALAASGIGLRIRDRRRMGPKADTPANSKKP